MSNPETKPEGYVANPYGFAESTKPFYQGTLLPLLERHISVIDPWEEPVKHIFKAQPEDRPPLWLDLGDVHYDNIKNRAKIVVACLDQEPPDLGTAAEAVWASAHGIPVIGYRNDLRTSGEDGLPYNLMLGAAIRRSGGTEVTSLEALDAELTKRVPLL